MPHLVKFLHLRLLKLAGSYLSLMRLVRLKLFYRTFKGKLLVLQPSLALKQIAALLSHSQWMSRVDT